jgi:serine/threonine protein kinase
MAEVFLARRREDPEFARPLVIKRIQPQLMHDPRVAALFLAESRIAAQLSHPYLAEVFDVGRVDDTAYFAMEHVRGLNLSQAAGRARLQSIDVPWPCAARLFAQFCEVLAYAHAQQLVHCDVTPHNLMVTWEGAPKVLDFGIARAAHHLPRSASGFMGKPLYAAPEQHRRAEPTPLTDIYGLGLSLYEMLVGENPFASSAERSSAADAVLEQVPESIHRRRRDLPSPLVKLIDAALAKDPALRPGSVLAFRAALEGALMDARAVVGTPELARWLRELAPDAVPEVSPRAPSAPAPGGARSTQPIDPGTRDLLVDSLWKGR